MKLQISGLTIPDFYFKNEFSFTLAHSQHKFIAILSKIKKKNTLT